MFKLSKNMHLQVVRNDEERGLAIVQQYVDLGWKSVSKWSMGNNVYFITVVWESESDPVFPTSIQ